MALRPGAHVGAFEVISLLGQGGMGEVWRARDPKLNRDVALKVLPDHLANDPDRLARFKREAQVLAALNHPHVGGIYGFEETNRIRALVLELVEGPTLADRISRGPVSIGEALPIARQVAEALEAAHEQGIVHRDLKPSNIKVRPDGTVKVLDFGLAKGLETAPYAPSAPDSPTITSPVVTGTGVILGTAAYLSPEQARGKPPDRRADIWAFGCVVYELLTGRTAFDAGESVVDAMMSILTKEPDWSALPPATPPQVRRLLIRCLQKDPQKRLPHIGVARLEIDEALTASNSDALLPGTPLAQEKVNASVRGARRGVWPWAAIGLAALAVAVFLLVWWPQRSLNEAVALQRLSVDLGADTPLSVTAGAALAVSPDGQTVAFVAGQGAESQLYIRRLDELEATPLPGTQYARGPFFSPDGRWVGFFSMARLRKISVAGGAPIELGNGALGGTWSDDGSIVFSPRITGPLARVSSEGGTPEPLTTVVEGELTHRWPHVLPGGKAVLYTASASAASTANGNLVLQALPNGARRVLQQGATYGRFVASGHVVFVRAGTLFAMPFDLDRLEPTGTAVPVLEGMTTINSGATTVAGGAHFAVADTGTLIYLPGRSLDLNADPIVWLNRGGQTSPLRSVPVDWSNPRFSPDGSLLAMDFIDRGNTDVWVYDWARDSLSPLTSPHPADDLAPVWTPDGRRLVFSSNRNGGPNLYWQRADGEGEVQPLTESPEQQFATSWHPSGRYLAFRQINPQTGSDLMILPMEGDDVSGLRPGTPTVFLATPFEEVMPEFSPDGNWLAYGSNESGRYEVYVRPFPGPGSRWQASVDGSSGTFAANWSRTRPELLFETPDGQIMVTRYRIEGDAFRADRPSLWPGSAHLLRSRWGSFALHPDSERVALAPVGNRPALPGDRVVFLLNFFDELRRLAPMDSSR